MKINKIIKKYKENLIDINEAMELSLPYVKWVVKESMGMIDEDLMQEASIVLFDCFNKYENETGFSTYTFNQIRWHLIRYIRGNNIIRKPEYLYYNGGRPDKDISVISSHTKINSRDKENEVFLIDTYVSENRLFEESDNYFILHELSKGISNEKIGMLRLWLDGYTFHEIGNMYNISHEWASVTIKKSIKMMQDTAVKLGYIKDIKKPIKVSDPRVVNDIINNNGSILDISKRYNLTELQLRGLIKRLKNKGVI